MSKSDGLWPKVIGWFWPKTKMGSPTTSDERVSDAPRHAYYRTKKPEVRYNKINVLEKTPAVDAISDSDFIDVVYKGKEYWSIFKCPCGCGEVISLSLSTDRRPYWSVKRSEEGRPTLYPSVWQSKGCSSHFWIDDGRVYWCSDTGILPWIAKPGIYSKPK